MEPFGLYHSDFLKVLFVVALMLFEIQSDFLHDTFPATVIEDSMLDTPGLLKKYNYPSETHYVITEDDYLLCLHRIPNPGGRPVLLVHGILDTSSTWIFMGPWSGLGYYLFENGFDVWMGNVRGNRYSHSHIYENPSTSSKYWDFSFHEIGVYDLPAMIDYILKETNHKRLTYIGHSQGTTAYFVMCSKRPYYNSKIVSMHAIAPVAFLKNANIPLISLQKYVFNMFGNYEKDISFPNELISGMCLASKMMLAVCINFIYTAVGKETKEINATMWPVIFGHNPDGVSIKQVKHFIQLKLSGCFCQFDYGKEDNKKHYGISNPPNYDLSKVRSPVALYYFHNDILCNTTDVHHLAALLPNVIENNLFPYKNWNHLTGMWGMSSRKFVHKRILKIIKRSYEIKANNNGIPTGD